MQVNSISIDSAYSIVLPKYEVGGLLVVLLHHSAMPFPLFGELVGACAISSLVGVVGLEGLSVSHTKSGNAHRLCPYMMIACRPLALLKPSDGHTRPRRFGFDCG